MAVIFETFSGVDIDLLGRVGPVTLKIKTIYLLVRRYYSGCEPMPRLGACHHVEAECVTRSADWQIGGLGSAGN